MTSKKNNKKSYKKFENIGFFNFGKIINTNKCKKLQKKISKLRILDKNIFYKSEKEFKKKVDIINTPQDLKITIF